MGWINDLKLNRIRRMLAKKPYKIHRLVQKGKIDLTQEEFAQIYIDFYINPNALRGVGLTNDFLIDGITEDYLFSNPKAKEQVILDFINYLQFGRYYEELPSTVVSRLIEDHEVVSRINSELNLEEMFYKMLESSRYSTTDVLPKIKLLYQLGVKLDDRFIKFITEPFGELQESLYNEGVLTPELVSGMYKYRFEQMKQWVLDPNSKKSPIIFINPDLPYLPEDKFAAYWTKMDKQTGIKDTFSYIMRFYKNSSYTETHDIFGIMSDEEMYEKWLPKNGSYFSDPKEYFEEQKEKIRGVLFTSEGLLTDYFFFTFDSDTMLNKVVYYNWENGLEHRYNNSSSVDDFIRILATNMSALNPQFASIIKIWKRLGEVEDENDHEAKTIAEKNQETFLLYATGNHAVLEASRYYSPDGDLLEDFYKDIKLNDKALVILEMLDPNWQSHYKKEDRKYIEFNAFCLANDLDLFRLFEFYKQENIDKYFKDGKISRELIDKLLWPINKLARIVLLKNDETKKLLSQAEKNYLYFYLKYENNKTILSITEEQIEELFNGKDPSMLIKFLFINLEMEILTAENESIPYQQYLTEKEIIILEEYKKVPGALQQTYKDYIKEDIDNIDIEKVRFISDLFQRISLSNASELSSHIVPLAKSLLKKDNPLEDFSKIEDVFVRNNLPEVAKLFLTFQILHPDDTLISDFNLEESEIVSPVLREYSSNLRKIKTIIFSDLFKATIKSNNRSIKEYIESIEVGYKLFLLLEENKISISDLPERELKIVTIFKDHLIALYENMDKEKYKALQLTGDLKEDLHILASGFNPTELHNLPDRIVRSFGYFAGIKSLAELKSIIEVTALETDARNRARANNPEFFKVQKGDFVKGLGLGGVKHLNNILSNGSVSKEFLGDSAGSDFTPLDTDLSRILDEPDNISNAIDGTISNTYGPIWFVLKNDGRFNITRDSEDTYRDRIHDFSKIEMFKTVVDGHYGIRTGFASSDIDFIVVAEEDKRVYVEIVKIGFYIPVVDKKTGKLIFTPEGYDKLRSKMQGLSHYGLNTYEFSEELETAEVREIAECLANNEQEVEVKRNAILKHIAAALARVNLKLKYSIDVDLTEGFAELIDTGSTGRGTNMPGDGDFDLLMRIDNKIMADPVRLDLLKKAIQEELGTTESTIGTGDFRLKGIKLPELEEAVDIDISFVQRTNKVKYSSDMSIVDRLETIRREDIEKYKLVLANIILAKKVLKKAEAYKPNRGEVPQGGLGGIGVENWILQNGGSFITACRNFLELAEGKTYEEFKLEFQVWDFGENHFAEKKGYYVHDDFVFNNMSAGGFEKMRTAIKEFIEILEKEENIEETHHRGL